MSDIQTQWATELPTHEGMVMPQAGWVYCPGYITAEGSRPQAIWDWADAEYVPGLWALPPIQDGLTWQGICDQLAAARGAALGLADWPELEAWQAAKKAEGKAALAGLEAELAGLAPVGPDTEALAALKAEGLAELPEAVFAGMLLGYYSWGQPVAPDCFEAACAATGKLSKSFALAPEAVSHTDQGFNELGPQADSLSADELAQTEAPDWDAQLSLTADSGAMPYILSLPAEDEDSLRAEILALCPDWQG